MLWKYIEQAMGSWLVPPVLILALLTSRVIPHRQSQPEAYRLYIELLSRYAFSSTSTNMVSESEKIAKAVDDALQLSKSFQFPITELGQTVVLFVFTLVSELVNAIAEDSGLQLRWSEKRGRLTGNVGQCDMAIEVEDDSNSERQEHRENMRRKNIVVAIDMVRKLTQHKRTSTFLRLVYWNMPEQWSWLCQRTQKLEAYSSSSNLKIAGELLTQLAGYIQRSLEYQPSQHQAVRALIDAGSQTSAFGHNYGLGRASPWLPFDLFMENAMDGKQLPATSAIETLAELTKSLQAVYGASWQETFLGLWTAALRLVRREQNPIEGPIPHIDSRLCILLSITPLVVTSIIEEEEKSLQAAENNANTNNHEKEKKVAVLGTRRAALLSSLKILGQFDGLLLPHQSVASVANQAAIKEASLVGSINTGSGTYSGLSRNGISSNAVGNMGHLIVEACIARKLIDSAVYLWPGYVGGLVNPLSHSIPVQGSPWSAFMEGSPLSISLRNALITTPASRIGESISNCN